LLNMRLSRVFKFMIPRGIWLKRTVLLFSFIFFDYFVTLKFCNSPLEEGNIYARMFMQSYGKTAGLTLFVLLINLPIYVILCLDSRYVRLPERFSTKVEVLVDLAFGWFVAGAHFYGAASWFWMAPSVTSQAVGLIIYELIALSSFYPFSPLHLTSSRRRVIGDYLKRYRFSERHPIAT